VRNSFYDSFKYAVLALLCVTPMLSQPAFAWGEDGHKIIAMLAEAQLTPAARKETHRLLALEPGQTLASISTWADQHRNPTTARWHYVNFPRGNCNYEPERDCADGKCIVSAIDRQTEILVEHGTEPASASRQG
jgi:hypothetical protein